MTEGKAKTRLKLQVFELDNKSIIEEKKRSAPLLRYKPTFIITDFNAILSVFGSQLQQIQENCNCNITLYDLLLNTNNDYIRQTH